MKQIVILGAGTAGTMMAQHLRRALPKREAKLTVVDQDPVHYYQPGFLFLSFGIYSEKQVIKPKKRLLPRAVEYIEEKVEEIAAAKNQVQLASGRTLDYDVLIVATGSHPDPSLVDGMLNGGWKREIFEFYTFEGARALRDRLLSWKGGKLVVHVCEMPIKCPVAPLEFAFLAEDWLGRRGLRQQTEITYVTPLPGAFTKPVASQILARLLEEKGIRVVPEFSIARVESVRRRIVSWDEKAVEYDLLVTVPPNVGDAVIERSGLGDELNFVPTDKHTLQSKAHANVFVIGDATDVPTSKAGSVAHFEAEVLTENVLHFLRGEPLRSRFDGHANCFIESGRGKGFLLDFNYELEPVPGKFPLAGLGPFSLLGESRLNHWGKMAFRWIYWHWLLRGIPIPMVGHRMSLAGKRIPEGVARPASAST